jgi:hypothetical protein
MGGCGSGNFGRKHRPPKRRDCVDFCKRVSISFLVRNGTIQPDRLVSKTIRFGEGSEIGLLFMPGSDRDTPYLRFKYRRGEVSVDDVVKLTNTKPRFGGVRWWFVCPGVSCGRRVGVLCLPPDDVHFRCRHCHNLAYHCQQSAHSYRAPSMFQDLVNLVTLRSISRLGPKPRRR